MFQFHPHSSAVRKLLRYDFEQHHEVKWSFENETNSYPVEKIPHEYLDEWKLAEKIVCASSFTKWSLVEQGCAAERIFVAPYGVVDGRPRRTVKHEKSQVCRFLFVGQGVQRKGLHHLLRAWHLDRPDDSELFVVSRRMDPGIVPLLDQPGITFLCNLQDVELEEFTAHQIYL